MQSKTHETLYRRLTDISAGVEACLGDDDPDALMGFAQEHRDVMNELRQMGTAQDPIMLEMAETAYDQVTLAIAGIRRQRDKLGRQLGTFEKKRRASVAYTRNMAP